MPRRKNKKTKPRQKGRGRVTRKTNRANPLATGGPKTTVIKGLGFNTDATRVQLRFVDTVRISAGAASGAYILQQYGLNTPRVPERTGSTGVSQGWAAFTSQYAAYVCLGSRIRWQITEVGNFTPASQYMVRMVIWPTDNNGTVPSNIADADVQKYSKGHNFGLATTTSGTATGSPYNRWTGSHSMTLSKISGEVNVRQPAYEAGVSSDPTTIYTWNLAFQDLLADTTAKPSYVVRMEIDYDVLFFQRKEQVNALVGVPLRSVVLAPAEEKKAPPTMLSLESVPDVRPSAEMRVRSVPAPPAALRTLGDDYVLLRTPRVSTLA